MEQGRRRPAGPSVLLSRGRAEWGSGRLSGWSLWDCTVGQLQTSVWGHPRSDEPEREHLYTPVSVSSGLHDKMLPMGGLRQKTGCLTIVEFGSLRPGVSMAGFQGARPPGSQTPPPHCVLTRQTKGLSYSHHHLMPSPRDSELQPTHPQGGALISP